MAVNVFKRPYSPWRNPMNWGRNVRQFFHSIRWAWQRATHGYAECDTWDLDSYLLDVLSGSIGSLAEHHWGYPGDDDFPTDVEWTHFLEDMSFKFYCANENNEYYQTPACDEWWELVKAGVDDDRIIIARDKMIEEDQRNADKRMQDFAEAWSAIGEHFWSLWD